jgi:hypothetical protein
MDADFKKLFNYDVQLEYINNLLERELEYLEEDDF